MSYNGTYIQVNPSPVIVHVIPTVEETISPPPKPQTKQIRKRNPLKAKKIRSTGFGIRKLNLCRQRHPLTEDNIYITGGIRRCKTCHRNRVREHKARLKNVS